MRDLLDIKTQTFRQRFWLVCAVFFWLVNWERLAMKCQRKAQPTL